MALSHVIGDKVEAAYRRGDSGEAGRAHGRLGLVSVELAAGRQQWRIGLLRLLYPNGYSR